MAEEGCLIVVHQIQILFISVGRLAYWWTVGYVYLRSVSGQW